MSTFQLYPRSGLGIAAQIRARIALQIADAELAPGDRLPSVRSLAGDLGVNVNTVRAAYAKLEADGLVATRQGIGSVVLATSTGGPPGGAVGFGANTIAVLIAGLNPFYLPMLRGIEDAASERGALVLITDSRDSPTLADAMMRRLIARGVDGIIAVSVGSTTPDPVPADGIARLPPSSTSTNPRGADTAWSSTGPARVTPPHATSTTTGTPGSDCSQLPSPCPTSPRSTADT